MRLKGNLKKHGVTILIDFSSTHNFLNPSLAKQCGCPVTTTTQFQVTVADGGVISSSGKCSHVPVNIQGFQFHLDFFLLPPLAILDRGIFKRNNCPVTKLLVQWQGQSKEEATWEECSKFAARFPSFQLADKLPS
ncbi:hypothetical protein WN944_027050 [Citrus x changshan-huyou]|uniref:Chromo domain-containing protein n=1 Tax=Citrus x changshan-huyou TaxID=2935761 RepID=A0AAP0LK31_9ROSI